MAGDAFELMKAALRNPLDVSTVFPTSKALAESMLSRGDFQTATRVVELGAGAGAITKHIVQRLISPDVYLGVELDPKMAEFLRREFPKLRFEQGPADQLGDWTPDNSVDLVISSLPWSLFPDEIQTKTIDAILKGLKPGGLFVTYVCAHVMLLPQARGFLDKLKIGFARVERTPLKWRNIPPAFVFVARK